MITSRSLAKQSFAVMTIEAVSEKVNNNVSSNLARHECSLSAPFTELPYNIIGADQTFF